VQAESLNVCCARIQHSAKSKALLARAGLFVCYHSRMEMTRIFGIVLALIAFSLTILGRVQLGKSFAFTPQAKGLVTHGLYSRIRNPMYTFVDLTICGIALALHFWYIALVLIVMVPLQIRNARKERRLLQEKFGEVYLEYKRGTWL
jgi:protein-S-isoprenylcysteine O-methyltransferase Ste14